LERPVREYTDEDVDRHLAKLLKRHGKLIDREGVAEPDDVLNVRVRVTHDGKLISENDNVQVTLLPNLSFRDVTIPGFDKLMVGSAVGDSRDTLVAISDGSESEAMRGQEVSVRFKVKEIRHLELPQMNQAFLDSIGGFEDEDELRAAVQNELERQAAFAQQRRLREQITAILIRGANWELPPDLVRRQAKRELERMLLELQSSGFSEDTIRSYINQIRQNSLRSTEAALKEHFIFERIAEDENIEAEPMDYESEIRRVADQSGDSVRRVRARLEKRGQMDALRNQIVERKVVDLICSKAEFTDTPLEDRPDDVCAIDLVLAGGLDSSDIPEAKHGGEAEELREPVERG
jgi:trigger factor